MFSWVGSANNSPSFSIILTLFFLATAVTGGISVFDFASLLGNPVGITTSTIGLNIICAMLTGIENYKSIIKKKKKKHNRIVLLAKTK